MKKWLPDRKILLFGLLFDVALAICFVGLAWLFFK